MVGEWTKAESCQYWQVKRWKGNGKCVGNEGNRNVEDGAGQDVGGKALDDESVDDRGGWHKSER